MAHTYLYRFEQHETPFPLGRHIEHDSRSRNFAFQVPAAPIRHVSVTWPHSAPVLDQAQTNSCTGNAITQLLNCDMYESVRTAHKQTWMHEAAALHIYGLGTHLDGFGSDQFYPPNDDGCTGLGVAKAAQQLGYIDRYQHCFTMTQLQAAIQTQPLIVGTSWTNSMFSPDPQTGIVAVGPLNDQTVVGGHEYLCQGIDYQLQCLVFLNSWSDKWGGGQGLSGGQFRIRFTDFNSLLADSGDIIVPHGARLPG
jgi:hypothetical protein